MTDQNMHLISLWFLSRRNKRVAATYVLVLTPVRELAVQARKQ